MSIVNAEIKKKIETFAAMPVLCQFLVEHLNDPSVDLQYLADQLRYDPGMTTNVLRVANSAAYGGRGQVDSGQCPIARLGIDELFEMLGAVGISKTLKNGMVADQQEPEE